MKCFSCNIEIPHTFTFALSENKCPGCGKEILDEETRALKSDIVKFVGSSINLKMDTLEKLAMMLISRYDIQGIPISQINIENTIKPIQESPYIEIEEELDEKEQAILNTDEEIRKLQAQRNKEMQVKELDNLKGEALKEAMRDKYNINFSGDEEDKLESSPTDFGDEDLPPIIKRKLTDGQHNPESSVMTEQDSATAGGFGDVSPLLEAAHLKQKVKGIKAMQGGKESSFRRSVI